jgi:hypothetical protein
MIMTTTEVRRWATRNLLITAVVGAAVVGADGFTRVDAQGWARGRGGTLNGTYQLNVGASDNVAKVADQVTASLPARDQQRMRRAILRRLEAPESLAIERRGRTITLASSNAEPVTFEANGQTQTEQVRNGRTMRTTTSLVGERLDVSTAGDRSMSYQVSFEPLDGGRRLRVTRRITDDGLRQTAVARSVYDRTSTNPRLDMYSTTAVDRDRRNTDRFGNSDNGGFGNSNNGRFGNRADVDVPDGTEFVATLDRDLSTKASTVEDPFTLTVVSPQQYEGARINGRVLSVDRSGRLSNRASMAFEFDSIRQRNGRTGDFSGYLEDIRTTRGETLRVENGTAEDDDSRTGRTATRTGIGAGIGALIGAIAGGGKGAAIGAAIGTGAGAGSVIVQGREDLELLSGSEFRIRSGQQQQ